MFWFFWDFFVHFHFFFLKTSSCRNYNVMSMTKINISVHHDAVISHSFDISSCFKWLDIDAYRFSVHIGQTPEKNSPGTQGTTFVVLLYWVKSDEFRKSQTPQLLGMALLSALINMGLLGGKKNAGWDRLAHLILVAFWSRPPLCETTTATAMMFFRPPLAALKPSLGDIANWLKTGPNRPNRKGGTLCNISARFGQIINYLLFNLI